MCFLHPIRQVGEWSYNVLLRSNIHKVTDISTTFTFIFSTRKRKNRKTLQSNLIVSANNCQWSTHPSPDTEMRCLRSFMNFTPVTTSEWPYMDAMSSPLKKSYRQMFLLEQVVARYAPDWSSSTRMSVPSEPTDPL